MTRLDAIRAAAMVAIEITAIVFVSLRLQSRIADPDDGRAMRWLIGLVLAATQVVGICLLLGAATILRPETVLVAHLALAVVILARVRPGARRSGTTIGSGDVAAVSLGLSLATLAALAELRGPSFSFDTSWYHIVNAAQWLSSNSTWQVPFSVPGTFLSFYPGSSDLVGTWLMLPTHQDQLAYLAPIAFGALLILSTAVLSLELRAPAWLGGLVGLALVATPLTWQFQAHSLMSDLLATGAVVAAISFVLRGARQPARAGWPLLAGASLGIGIGSKYTAWVPSVLVLVVIVALYTPGHRLRALSAAAVGSASLGGFWLVRNLVATANPIFPGGLRVAGVQVFAAGDSPYQDALVPLAHWIVRGDQAMLFQLATWAGEWYGPVLLLVAIGIGAGTMQAGGRDRRRLLVLAFGVAGLVAYTFTPASGGYPVSPSTNLFMLSEMRYPLPALAVLAALAVAVAPRWLTLAGVVLALGYDGYRIADWQHAANRPDLEVGPATVAVMAAVTTVVVGVVWAQRRGWWERLTAAPRPQVRTALAVAGLLVLAIPPLAYAIKKIDVRQGPDSVSAALTQTGKPNGPILVINVVDTRPLLGPYLDRRLVGAGEGQVGRQVPPATIERFNQLITQTGATVAVVDQAPRTQDTPAGWVPPSSWQRVGYEGGGNVYLIAPPPGS